MGAAVSSSPPSSSQGLMMPNARIEREFWCNCGLDADKTRFQPVIPARSASEGTDSTCYICLSCAFRVSIETRLSEHSTAETLAREPSKGAAMPCAAPTQQEARQGLLDGVSVRSTHSPCPDRG